MRIRPLGVQDAEQWVAARHALWPDARIEELAKEIRLIAVDPAQVALGAFADSVLVGFVELSLHPHAVGCASGPVAYLEAWYVEATHRRQGVGQLLVAAGEHWGREQDCRELASDTWLDNDTSHHAHRALGFDETERLIHYRKKL